jgi:SPP1 gp7 family putative phage head morphogenesis protein
LSDDERLKTWLTFDKVATNNETDFERAMIIFFSNQESRALSNVKSVKALNADEILNWKEEDRRLLAVMSPLWLKSFSDGANTVSDTYGFNVNFNLLNPKFLEWVETNGAELVKGINETTKKGLQSTISEGIQDGDSIPEIRKRVQAVFDTASKSRANTIARTETHGSVSNGTFQTYSSAGLEKKEWLATLDPRTRDSHLSINRQVVDIDKKFSNGLMFPGDSSGSAKEVINCRCTLLPVIQDSVPYKPEPVAEVTYVDPWLNRPKEIPKWEDTKVKESKRGHLSTDMTRVEIIDDIAKQMKVEKDRAEQIYNSVRDYSGNDYGNIRRHFYDEITDSKYWEKALDIEEFIRKMPKYKSGNKSLYRGFATSEGRLAEFEVGKPIDMKGMNSWSSSLEVAEGFSSARHRKKMSVIIQVQGLEGGVSLKHMSMHQSEDEVISTGMSHFVIEELSKDESGRNIVKVKEVMTRNKIGKAVSNSVQKEIDTSDSSSIYYRWENGDFDLGD